MKVWIWYLFSCSLKACLVCLFMQQLLSCQYPLKWYINGCFAISMPLSTCPSPCKWFLWTYSKQAVVIKVFSFIQDTVTVSEDCTNGQDIKASYELSYTTDCGNPIATCIVDGRECSNCTCRHELQSNVTDGRCQPPVSQFSGEGVTVSVTARNIVGRSNSSVSRSISEFICWTTVMI